MTFLLKNPLKILCLSVGLGVCSWFILSEPACAVPLPREETSKSDYVAKNQYATGLKNYLNRDYKAAVLNLESVTERDPANPMGWYYLANTQMALGALKEARASYQQALNLSSDPVMRQYCVDSLTKLVPLLRVEVYNNGFVERPLAVPGGRAMAMAHAQTSRPVDKSWIMRTYRITDFAQALSVIDDARRNIASADDYARPLIDQLTAQNQAAGLPPGQVKSSSHLQIAAQRDALLRNYDDSINATLQDARNKILLYQAKPDDTSAASTANAQAEAIVMKIHNVFAELDDSQLRVKSNFRSKLEDMMQTQDNLERQATLKTQDGTVNVVRQGTDLNIRNYINYGGSEEPLSPLPSTATPAESALTARARPLTTGKANNNRQKRD